MFTEHILSDEKKLSSMLFNITVNMLVIIEGGKVDEQIKGIIPRMAWLTEDRLFFTKPII
jgi:hypothetical protein